MNSFRAFAIAAACLAASTLSNAGTGGLDPAFGNAGRAFVNSEAAFSTFEGARAVALQSDGKIVAAGFGYTGASGYSVFTVVRLNADGTTDTSFGSTGRATLGSPTVGGSYDLEARGVAIQSDGKIVVGGSGARGGGFALGRFNADGTVDASF